MLENTQLQLQLVINKLLELSHQENDVQKIVKKSLNIILNSPVSSSISNKGIIFITEDNSKLRLVAKKNIEKEIALSCRKVDFSECVCGMAAHTKQVQFTSCITHLHKKTAKTKNYGHYSIPILYNETVYGVLTLYLKPNHVQNKVEIETLQTITKTLGLIIYKKRLAKFAGFNRTKLDVSFGQTYFNTLAKFLIKELDMKYCAIGSYNKQENTVTTFAFTQNSKVLKNITYHLEGTPCDNVFEAAYCFYPQNIQQLFPKDTYLKQLGVESYFGMPLINEKKVRIGIITLLGDKPISDELEKKEILNVFIPRLVSECERKIFEDTIKRNEIKYKDVFDKFQDIFIRATLLPNGESVIAEVSESIFKFLGYKPAELIGKPSSIFYHNTIERDEMIKTLLKHKQIKDYPITLLKKNGTPIYVQITAQLVFEKEIPKEIRIIARDVSEKRNEEIRKEITYLIARKTQRRIINIKNLAEFVYKALGSIMDTSNFYITLIDKENNSGNFIVFADQKVKIEDVRALTLSQYSLIEYIIATKTIFIKNEEELKNIIIDNNLTFKSPIPKILICFPLKNEGVVVGLLTVKSYKNENAFTKNDIELLDFIATQLSNIIEKDQWQKSLIDKEKYFRSLVESSLEVTGIVDENGKINYISESVKAILGYEAYSVISKNFYDFIPEHLYQKIIDTFETILLKNTIKNPYKVKVVCKDGKNKIIQFSLNNQLKNKQIQGIIFNAQDITEKYYSEKKLEQSKQELIKHEIEYKTIFNNANEGIIRFTKDCKIVDVNKRMSTIIGYSKNELLNKTFFDLTEKSSERLIKNDLKKLLTKKSTKLLLEKKMIHKNGKNISCKIFVKPIFTDNNKFEYFIAFITDVTKRTEAILKAIELEHALNTSTNVLYVDVNGYILNASEKLLNKTGYTLKELKGKHTRIFNSKFHSKEFFKNLWDTVLSGQVWSGEVRNVNKDGSYFWIFATIIPIKNMNNQISHFINVRQDITELKYAKVEKIKGVIDAQEKEKENFAKELHDGLGQMLLASKMNLCAIEDKIDTLDESTQAIYANTIKLFNDAIQETRAISHGLMSRVLYKFGLAHTINELILDINRTHTNLVIEYNHNINDKRFEPEIEKGLYRVLQELIANIIKHSNATLAQLDIYTDGRDIKLSVKDNGDGLLNNILLPNKELGIGLKNIETRIEYLSGTFSINEDCKVGTEINISVPL